MTSYWTSNKIRAGGKERLVELKLLLDFSNVDLTTAKDLALKTRLLDHLYQHQALHPDNRDWRPEEKNVERILKCIQVHLRSRLEAIFQKNSEMELWDDLPLWPINGTINLFVDPKSHGFHELFQFAKVTLDDETKKSGKELDDTKNNNLFKIILLLSDVLDLILLEIIRDMDLTKGHFCKCPRCSSYFYNPTDKERISCSTRCTNAVRQQKYREGKEGKDE